MVALSWQASWFFSWLLPSFQVAIGGISTNFIQCLEQQHVIFRVLEATLAQKKHLAALATGLIRAWPQAGRGTLARCIFFGDARVLIRV